jgi:hypothetical protein
METSMMQKLTAQMEKDASQQRQALEDIIEEKVSKALEGTCLKVNMAVQEVKRETERVTKLAARDRTPGRTPPRARTPRRTPPVRTPLRIKTPPCGGDSDGGARGVCGGSAATPERVPDANTTSIEDSFAETMRVIDDFVGDCDDIANDFDKIVFRMQDADVPSDPDCDPDEFVC